MRGGYQRPRIALIPASCGIGEHNMPRLRRMAHPSDYGRTKFHPLTTEENDMPLSKPFVIATEGPTIDGRNISRDWINQMAANYSPNVYTAVANLEHLLSYAPDSLFSAYGKVVSLSVQEAQIMGEKKLQLMAVVDVSESVVAMQKAGKKLFASIEVVSNFIGKGIAYLTGLAFTDTPASIGTESMKFSANKDDVYSFNTELAIEFEEAAKQPSAGETLFSKVKALLSFEKKDNEARFTDVGQAVEAIAQSQKKLLDLYAGLPDLTKIPGDELRQQIADMDAAQKKTAADFAAFKTAVEATPNGTGKRPSATGGTGSPTTDC